MMTCEPNQQPKAQVELKINGEEVDLNTFVEGFISETLFGMVKSLRGVGSIDRIDLRIVKNPENG